MADKEKARWKVTIEDAYGDTAHQYYVYGSLEFSISMLAIIFQAALNFFGGALKENTDFWYSEYLGAKKAPPLSERRE